jgi:hypothetical protein
LQIQVSGTEKYNKMGKKIKARKVFTLGSNLSSGRGRLREVDERSIYRKGPIEPYSF